MKPKERKKIEVEVVRMLSEGLTAAQIGDKKKMTTRQTQDVINQTRVAYDAYNTPHLVAIFFRNKLIE